MNCCILSNFLSTVAGSRNKKKLPGNFYFKVYWVSPRAAIDQKVQMSKYRATFFNLRKFLRYFNFKSYLLFVCVFLIGILISPSNFERILWVWKDIKSMISRSGSHILGVKMRKIQEGEEFYLNIGNWYIDRIPGQDIDVYSNHVRAWCLVVGISPDFQIMANFQCLLL